MVLCAAPMDTMVPHVLSVVVSAELPGKVECNGRPLGAPHRTQSSPLERGRRKVVASRTPPSRVRAWAKRAQNGLLARTLGLPRPCPGEAQGGVLAHTPRGESAGKVRERLHMLYPSLCPEA